MTSLPLNYELSCQILKPAKINMGKQGSTILDLAVIGTKWWLVSGRDPLPLKALIHGGAITVMLPFQSFFRQGVHNWFEIFKRHPDLLAHYYA
jgi:hypothetical protein